ncbi:MAG: EVE domain-containing protein [Planctomycetota bacterium]
MPRNYWLDLFTGKTWEEFFENGGTVSGFRHRLRRMARKIQIGDYLICHVTGISRIIGVLEVKSKCYEDYSKIWEDADFLMRFKVEIKYQLTPETAIPIQDLKDKLLLFENLSSPHAWTGFFRQSPAKFKEQDGIAITEAVKEAIQNPIKREYDKAKYNRTPKKYESKKMGVVTVPDEKDREEEELSITEQTKTSESTHLEIQWLLLKLGSDLGLDVWVARNDKNRSYNGNEFKNIKNIRSELPLQFDDATNKTIELIDVLWLQGDAIIAAFEVEHTSAIYSGLLRMSDLISMQPNIKIDLYLVAPDEKYEKVFSEVNRPTFKKLKPPLPKICQFIPYSKLKKEVELLKDKIKYIKPEFIAEIAISCEPDEA